jgi:hypothetical protein
MPLLDHFRSPLSPGRRWESFYAMWANTISDALNGALLPPGYFSEIRMHLRSGVGTDSATFRRGAARADGHACVFPGQCSGAGL